MAKRNSSPKQAGVWTLTREGRPKPFGVQWREQVRDPAAGTDVYRVKTEFFETLEQRDARRAVLVRQRRTGSLSTVSNLNVADWKAFQSATGGTDWREVVSGWQQWKLHAGLQQCELTVQQAVDSCLSAADADLEVGDLAPDTERQKRHKLKLFAAQLGHLRLDKVESAEIEAWIKGCEEVKSKVTFNNYRKHVSALFQPHVDAGRLRRNPVTGVNRASFVADNVGVLSVKDTAKLFDFAYRTPKYMMILGRLACEAFVGLRFASACRLEKKDINFSDQGLLLPAAKLKTRKRHYIDGLPGQVWEWLAVTPEGCWSLTARNYMKLKSELFGAAGVPHLRNCMRHSFATYDVAAHKNPGRTALILCHTNQNLLWSNYKGVATKADGELYQRITPETAADIAAGKVLPPPAPTPQTAPAPAH